MANAVIHKIIINAIEELNNSLEVKLPVEKKEQCIIFGEGSVLDSIALVTLIASIEQGLEDAFDMTVILVSEKAMSMKNSPFSSVGRLTDYAEKLVSENSND